MSRPLLRPRERYDRRLTVSPRPAVLCRTCLRGTQVVIFVILVHSLPSPCGPSPRPGQVCTRKRNGLQLSRPAAKTIFTATCTDYTCKKSCGRRGARDLGGYRLIARPGVATTTRASPPEYRSAERGANFLREENGGRIFFIFFFRSQEWPVISIYLYAYRLKDNINNYSCDGSKKAT